jgi:thiamine kinase-like enzyme
MSTLATHILARHFPGREWLLRKPDAGLASISYVATSEDLELFVKLDADAEVVQRVAELGIAPPVVASGTHQGQTYVIQYYIQGTHPDRAWFSLHLPQLATVIEKYHHDPVLRLLLAKGKPPGYEEHITAELRYLGALLAGLPESPQRAELYSFFDEFKDQARAFDSVDLVPAHADPNYHNFLLVGEMVYLLDWEGVTLSDPLRDVGPLLWWYVPREKWPEFFAACSNEMDAQRERKVYWWAARQSCSVALWFAGRGLLEQATPFMIDFEAALHGRANPHG